MRIHAYRLVYRESPHAPEMLWEWEEPFVHMLIAHARALHREVVQRSFSTWDDLALENQRIWETYSLPRPLYQLAETWYAWLNEYREIVRDVQDMMQEHSGRRREDQPRARQHG